MGGIYFGIDLGTGNCSAAFVRDDPRRRNQPDVRVEVVPMPRDEEETLESHRMPSVIGVDPTGRARRSLLGWEFFKAFLSRRRAAPLRRGVEYLSSVKSDMGTCKVYLRSAVPGIRTPAAATAKLLGQIIRAAHARTGEDPTDSHVTITVPASFSSEARKETLAAAGAAGFDLKKVELVDEPVAALIDLLNDSSAASVLTDSFRNVLVFDYGAGTCDLSLVKARFDGSARNGIEVINLAISPYRRLGGDDVDRALMEEVIWPQLVESGKGFESLNDADRRALEDTLTPLVARRLKEKICRRVAAEGWTRYKPTTEETLSNVCQFEVEGCVTPRRFKISAAQFERVMEPFIAMPEDEDEHGDSLLGPVIEIVRKAGLQLEDLDVLVLHGGSSLNPFVQRMLSEQLSKGGSLFGSVEVVRTPDPLSSVARGAAISAYSRHVRQHEFVSPILSEEIGIVTLGGEARPLVRAGAPVPYPTDDGVREVTEGSTRFVVPDSNLREVLVPVYTGRQDPPRIAETIRVPLAAGTPQGESVRIKLRIDHEKQVFWWFSVGDREFVRAKTLHDPWTHTMPNRWQEELGQHRRRIRALVDDGDDVPIWHEINELRLLRFCGRHDEAVALLQTLVGEHRDNSRLINMEGLLLGDVGDHQKALDRFRRAAELDPQNAIIVGNYGSQLAHCGDPKLAVPTLRRALSLDSELPYVYLALADVLRQQGDEPGATNELNRCVEVLNRKLLESPADPQLHRQLASAREQLGDYELARRARTEAAKVDRDRLFGGDSDAVIADADGRRSWPSAV